MKRRTWVVGGVVLALASADLALSHFWNKPGAIGTLRNLWIQQTAVAQAPGGGPRTVAVAVAVATRQNVPVRLEALGNVTTMASVAIKSRLDSEIIGVHFADGARVKQGDVL